MDAVILESKLDSLGRCIQRVVAKCPDDVATLRNDPDLQDIVVLNLSRAVQLCVDIANHWLADSAQPTPATMGQSFDLLARDGCIPEELADRLKKSVGFRNIAVHNYEDLDWAIVHTVAKRHLEDFRAFARAVETAIQGRN
jgi:uncharacterized protein YutE (UPF0331/DUF86 family)